MTTQTAYPILYIRDSKGKERQWSVSTDEEKIIVTYGVIGGKLTQKITKAKAKNIGKANETTPAEQAILEAEAKWRHQIDREDYNEDINEAGHQLRPMLALDATKVGHRIQWEDAYEQPKLDGLRLVVGTRDTRRGYVPDELEMLTRKGEVYQVRHMVDPAKEMLKIVNHLTDNRCIALDGECYLHGLPLQTINSYAKKYQAGLTELLEFHLFDLVIPGMSFVERYAVLKEAFGLYADTCANHQVRNIFDLVPCRRVRTPDEMKVRHGEYTIAGYEGIMIRHGSSEYGIAQRSPNLFKYKEFYEKECLIVGMWEDNNGNAMLDCLWDHTNTDTQFGCTPKRTHEYRKQMLNEQDEFIGKWITVKYQALTLDGLPEFPVGLALRECDDNGQPLH